VWNFWDSLVIPGCEEEEETPVPGRLNVLKVVKPLRKGLTFLPESEEKRRKDHPPIYASLVYIPG